MVEIEAKFLLKDLESVKQKLLEYTTFEQVDKEDLYLENSRDLHVRIRRENNSYYLTVKNKCRPSSSCEVNNEFEVTDPFFKKYFKKLKKSGKVVFYKTKKGLSGDVTFNSVCIHVELLRINNRFDYLEAEVLRDKKDLSAESMNQAIGALEELIKCIGIDWEEEDERSWDEILKEV